MQAFDHLGDGRRFHHNRYENESTSRIMIVAMDPAEHIFKSPKKLCSHPRSRRGDALYA
jgi:hypothetical protein